MISILDFNIKVTTPGISKEQVSNIKQRRRTLKNRGYAATVGSPNIHKYANISKYLRIFKSKIFTQLKEIQIFLWFTNDDVKVRVKREESKGELETKLSAVDDEERRWLTNWPWWPRWWGGWWWWWWRWWWGGDEGPDNYRREIGYHRRYRNMIIIIFIHLDWHQSDQD